jgi:hypothetical protein
LIPDGCLGISRFGPELLCPFFRSVNIFNHFVQRNSPKYLVIKQSIKGETKHLQPRRNGPFNAIVDRRVFPFSSSKTFNMSTPYDPRIPLGDAPQLMPVAGLSLSIPENQSSPPEARFDGQPRNVGTKEATRNPSTNPPQKTAPARPTSDSAMPQLNIPVPSPSAIKPKGKYSSRITFLSPTIRNFTALRDKLLKLSHPIKSEAMDTIIEKLQPLIEDPAKSDLIEFMWETRLRLNTMLSSMLKDLGKFDKISQSRRYQDDPESAYSKEERKKARGGLKKDMVTLEQILRSYFVKKSK